VVGDNEGDVKLGGWTHNGAYVQQCHIQGQFLKYNFHNFWCTQANLHYKPTIDLDKRKDNKFHDHMMQHKHSMHVKIHAAIAILPRKWLWCKFEQSKVMRRGRYDKRIEWKDESLKMKWEGQGVYDGKEMNDLLGGK
jgi:hypothetical protein